MPSNKIQIRQLLNQMGQDQKNELRRQLSDAEQPSASLEDMLATTSKEGQPISMKCNIQNAEMLRKLTRSRFLASQGIEAAGRMHKIIAELSCSVKNQSSELAKDALKKVPEVRGRSVQEQQREEE